MSCGIRSPPATTSPRQDRPFSHIPAGGLHCPAEGMAPEDLSTLSVLGEQKALRGLFPPALQPPSLQPNHTGLSVAPTAGIARSCLRAFTCAFSAVLNVLSSRVHTLLFTCSQRPFLGTSKSSHPRGPPCSSVNYFLCDGVSTTNSLAHLFGDFNIL